MDGHGRGPYRDAQGRSAARPLTPRSAITTLGTHRRSIAPFVLAGIAAVAVAGGVTWWLMTRPAAATITSAPADAVVRLGSLKPGTGRVVADKMEPGDYPLTVERKGFEPFSASVTLERGRRLERTVKLVPRSFEVSFTARPAGATVKLVAADGAVFDGKTPCRFTVPAGDLSVTVDRAGYNTFASKDFLDEAKGYDLLLDPKGQIVHALGSVACAGAPKGVALTPNGSEAWSAILNGPPSIQIFEPRSGRKVGDIDLGKAGAVEVIFNRAGTRAYVSQME
ncbi:MAG TPA: PEGA domain-containing protein, partial [Coriobacteriia bacterium]